MTPLRKSQIHVVGEKKTIDGSYYRDKILLLYENALTDKKTFPKPELAILQQDAHQRAQQTPHNTLLKHVGWRSCSNGLGIHQSLMSLNICGPFFRKSLLSTETKTQRAVNLSSLGEMGINRPKYTGKRGWMFSMSHPWMHWQVGTIDSLLNTDCCI